MKTIKPLINDLEVNCNYQSPKVEVIYIEVEKGFATSPDINPFENIPLL